MLHRVNKLIGAAALLVLAFPAISQNTMETFGKNRIQYKNFDWKYLTTPNFEVYYYQGGNEIAAFAARYAEADFDRIADLLGYTPYSKTKVFIYNSIADLQQSNVGLDDNNEQVIGGQTNFIKSRVEIPYTGNQTDFRKELSLGISRQFIVEMMFGGSLRDMVQSSYLLTLPEWFVSGAAAYVAEGWSVEMDNYIRDAVTNKNLRKPSILTGEQAVVVGQSIWNFIAERYGRSNISNILNLTRIIRNEESSISSTLGIAQYSSFLSDWRNYYATMASPVTSAYPSPEPDFVVRKNRRNKFSYNQVAISPDGRQLAYSENVKGKYRVYVRPMDKNKRRTITWGGYKAINQRVNPEIPLLNWRDNKFLITVTVRQGKNYLTIYDTEKHKHTRRPLESFNQITSIDVSDDGSAVVMSADRNGRNDVYLLEVGRNSIKALTHDRFDDLDPQFMPNSNSAIVFSSNRPTDSLTADKGGFQIIDRNFDLMLYDPAKSTTLLTRLTNAPGNEMQAVAAEGTVFYLGDENGIKQLYKYTMSSGETTQVTGFRQDIEAYDISLPTGSLAYLMIHDGDYSLDVDTSFDFNTTAPALRTRRVELLDERSDGAARTKQPATAKQPTARKDSSEVISTQPQTEQLVLSEGEVDTENYQFDADSKQRQENDGNKNRRTLLSPPVVANARKQNVSVNGPFPYQSRFSTDNVISSVLIDPLRGLGVLFNISMNDILENHKISGGLLGITDLRSSDFFGEYQYLKGRIDYGAKFFKRSIFASTEINSQRYTLNRIQLSASYPFNVSSRVTVAPFYVGTKYTELGTTLQTIPVPDRTTSYAGFRAEYVFDNTVINGLNMIEGTRFKIRFDNYAAVNKPEESFNNFSIDLRNYKRIHRDIIFATRLAYGQFGGKARKNYLLGGMDNWLFNRNDNQGQNDPLRITPEVDNRDLLFVEFTTPLRGFNYNKLYGHNYVLFNAEFRFPIIKYFYRGPITSNFFKNLQLVAFTDIGAAWTGRGPFSRQNSLNTNIEGGNGNPFRASVTNFKNPFLSGHGAGVRTLLLGYYVKFDVAWGVEDFVASGPKYYLTLGYDF